MINYNPRDYEDDDSVYVFSVLGNRICDGEYFTYHEVFDLFKNFPCEDEYYTDEEIHETLCSGMVFRIGSDDSWYKIFPLNNSIRKNSHNLAAVRKATVGCAVYC